jgi:TonB family protein
MHTRRFLGGSRLRSWAGSAVLRLAAFALVVILTLPSQAAGDRAVKSRVAPVYPEIAKRMRITGEVRLEAVVDASGKVKDVKAVSGNHMLEVAAEDAVRKWRFVPGVGDETVAVAVNFDLAR